MSNASDKKYVVVRATDNARISGRLHENEADASRELTSLTESVTTPSGQPEFRVVQVLNG